MASLLLRSKHKDSVGGKKTHKEENSKYFAFTDIYAIFNWVCACYNLNCRGEKSHKQGYYANNNVFLKQVSNSVTRLEHYCLEL